MNKAILNGGLVIVLFLFVFCFNVQAQDSAEPVLFDADEASETEVVQEKSSTSGFWQNLWRKLEITFTVDPIKKIEKRLVLANENLIKAQTKVESGEDETGANQALHEFNKQIKKVQNVVPKLQVQREGDERVLDLVKTADTYKVRHLEILKKLEKKSISPAFKELINNVKTQVEQKVESVDKASIASEPLSATAKSKKKNLQPKSELTNAVPAPQKNTDFVVEPTSTGSGSDDEAEIEPQPVSVYDHKYSGKYQITYDLDNVELAIGGMKTTASLDEISNGGVKIGTADIPGGIADDLKEILTEKAEFVIAEKQLINHPISMKDLATGTKASGFYDPRLEKFYFGDLSSVDPSAKECGAIGGSLWGGHFTKDKIDYASSTVGFIGGCKGILISARAKIPWTAVKLAN